MVAVLIEAVKELTQKYENLQVRTQTLESKLQNNNIY